MGTELRGGKTVPRLLQDLVDFDPKRLSSGGGDTFAGIPFHDASKEDEDPLLPHGGCRHHWALKLNQIDFPEADDTKPSPSTPWTLACYCAKCRCHLDVIVGYEDAIGGQRPCPSSKYPLHHFVYQSDPSVINSPDTNGLGGRGWPSQDRRFRCSAPSCGAILSTKHKAPRLSEEWVLLLTDKVAIKTRAEKAIRSEPDKFQGHACPLPGGVLETLWRLVVRALNEPENRPYARDGKSFLLNLGEPCAELLRLLGFSSNGGPWEFPKFDNSTSTPFTDPKRILLDDVREEVCVLMLNQPVEERRSAKFNFVPSSAMGHFRRALDSVDYRKKPKNLTVDMTAIEHPCYGGLGAVVDFHDELIVFAYDRQITVDSAKAPYYLECLQTIANGRESEELGTKAAIEASAGRVSLRDIRQAYGHLNIDWHNDNMSDDTIIGNFQARLVDSPKQEAELRRDLSIIGRHRSSLKIQDVAAQTLNTYEQAMSFLEVPDGSGDDIVIALYGVKKASNPSEEENARKAVALIANHRKSRALKDWLNTGDLGKVEMSIGQAYARLDISARDVEDDGIIASFQIHTAEQPSQAEELRTALKLIAEERRSEKLRNVAGSGSDESSFPLNEWPVALNNIGNTCYLNSLLQFYFSIRPFRDLVLTIDDFRTDLDAETIRSKRIGGRSVSRKEVERGQRTAEELRKLFNDLITSPTRSVRPDTEVARLTLLTPKAEIARRQSIRKSLNNGERPLLSDIGGQDVLYGPEGPPESVAEHHSAVEMENTSSNHNKLLGVDGPLSNSSSETLVDESTTVQDTIVLDRQDKTQMSAGTSENHMPGASGSNLSNNEEETVPLRSLTDSPPPLGYEQNGSMEIDGLSREGQEYSDATTSQKNANGPPSQPPPVPPRPKPAIDPDEAVKEAEFAAQQQDVNEIAYNILNQLECAIRPQEIGEGGEQIDEVKRLFYGKQKTYITSQSGTVRSKEEYMSDIKVNVQGGPRDIYAALDGAFDVEDVAVAGSIEPKYSTISHLPPILQIHIQRVQYDPAKKRQFKSDNHLELKETIYMDRYMDTSDDELLRRRKESWGWKRRLASLETRRDQLTATDMGMDMPEVLECATGYLQQLEAIDGEHSVEVPSMLGEALKLAARDARTELQSVRDSIAELQQKISTQFNGFDKIAYTLAAVFFHRGSSNAGHYWIYILDFGAKLWRKYNDESVKAVQDASEIFDAPTEDRPPTPYFLVYVQDEYKSSLVDPVCRKVVEPPASELEDTTMQDFEPVDLVGGQAGAYGAVPTTVAGPTTNSGWNDSQFELKDHLAW